MPPQVNSWRQSGSVSLWRYRDNVRNYPGWHLSTDKAGGYSLLELLAALQASRSEAHRTVQVTAPTPEVLAVPNNQNGRARWWAPTRWRIRFNPHLDTSSLWSFPPETDPAVLSVGREFISKLAGGIGDLTSGGGDYTIRGGESSRSEDTCLWFWWRVPSNNALQRTRYARR